MSKNPQFIYCYEWYVICCVAKIVCSIFLAIYLTMRIDTVLIMNLL